MKIFRRSWHEEEKCCKLSGWANIIFVKEVSRLDSCYSMRSNNSLALRVTTHRYRFDQEIFKNSPLIAQFKIFWGVLLLQFLKLKSERNFFYQITYISTFPSLMILSKLKKVKWSPWCSTVSSSSFGYSSL